MYLIYGLLILAMIFFFVLPITDARTARMKLSVVSSLGVLLAVCAVMPRLIHCRTIWAASTPPVSAGCGPERNGGKRMILVTGSIIARGDAFDDVLRSCLEHVERSRKEPGCISHDVHVDCQNPMRLFFFEQWADEAALRTRISPSKVRRRL